MSGRIKGGSELGWGDVQRTMSALEDHHQVRLTLVCTPGVRGTATLAWTVCASPATRDPIVDEAWARRTWARTWNDLSPDTTPALARVYGLLLEFDAQLSAERWAQIPLPA